MMSSLAARAAAVAGALIAAATQPLSSATDAAQPPGESAPAETLVRVAHLVYSTNKTSQCFATGYLDLLARETEIKVDRQAVRVDLDSEDLYEYPFAVLSGEGGFRFTDAQFMALREYIERGGFILASAGCSNAEWNRSFRDEVRRLFPEGALEPLELSEDMFQTVFRISQLRTKSHNTEVKLFGMRVNGRLALVYSPEGLNDTGNAGGGCCCCGGDEIRDAKYINANILAWVLMH